MAKTNKNAEQWARVEKELRRYEELYGDEPKVYTDSEGNVFIYSADKFVITGKRTFTRWQKIKLWFMSRRSKKYFKGVLKNGND